MISTYLPCLKEEQAPTACTAESLALQAPMGGH